MKDRPQEIRAVIIPRSSTWHADPLSGSYFIKEGQWVKRIEVELNIIYDSIDTVMRELEELRHKFREGGEATVLRFDGQLLIVSGTREATQLEAAACEMWWEKALQDAAARR